MTNQSISPAWWQEMPNRACVLNYVSDEQIIAFAAELEEPLDGATDATTLRFRVFPVSGPHATAPPSEVRLLSIGGGSSCMFVLRVIEFGMESLVVDAQPVSSTQRPLRRFPRTPYQLGPCTAVVHSAVRQWRGLVEFWVHDVSPHGVGFAVVTGHADRVAVGDYLRAPVTLPDGQRSWIDGEVIWLTTDGRGGLLTRRAPEWRVTTTAPATMAMT
ncbi:MAG: PilZ domain-containing protein [Thermomicrobiales bacterium]